MSQPEQCWYIRTPIQQGEIFSSWLIRSALDVGCSPMVLIEALWGKWRALTIDLDKGVDAEKFEKVAASLSASFSIFPSGGSALSSEDCHYQAHKQVPPPRRPRACRYGWLSARWALPASALVGMYGTS